MEDVIAAPEELSTAPQGEAPPEPPVAPAAVAETGSQPAAAETPVESSVPIALFDSIARIEAATAAGFADLMAEFRGKLAYDQTKQQQVDRLHAELQGYRDERAAKPVRDILLGIVRLHDGIGKAISALRGRPEEELTPERLLGAMADFQDDIELLLGQHGVERFEESGETFDPRRQTVARSVPTDEPEQVGRIAEPVRPGFALGETLLQKERVAVYVATPGTNAKEPREQGDLR